MRRRVRGRLGGAAVLVALLVVGLATVLVAPPRPGDDGAVCPTAGGAVVVLDPGHGGVDPGALNPTYGLAEADLNLAIAERVAAILRAGGRTVALTRADGLTTLGNSERGAIANACGAEVFVSIHLNSFTSPEVNYAKSFWGRAGKDLAFAGAVQAALTAGLAPGTDLTDGGTEQFESGALLRAAMPAVLVEAAFLTNPTEAARLADPSGARLDQIARAVAAGVEGWL